MQNPLFTPDNTAEHQAAVAKVNKQQLLHICMCLLLDLILVDLNTHNTTLVLYWRWAHVHIFYMSYVHATRWTVTPTTSCPSIIIHAACEVLIKFSTHKILHDSWLYQWHKTV